MTRLRDERGFSLPEVLTAMTLTLVITTAALLVGTSGIQNAERLDRANEAEQQARLGLDQLIRQLRNLASPSDLIDPTKNQPLSVERNGRYDLVFKTVEDVGGASAANATGVKRVRYCLDATNPASSTVWRQEQPPAVTAGSAAAPPGTACPAAGWTDNRVIAQNLVNTYNGQNRPLFAYTADGRTLNYDQPTELTDTTRIEARVYVDTTPTRRPVETRMSSSVLLRNQNREPIANFTVNQTGRTVQLNGSASTDPENEQLTYEWFEGTTSLGKGLVLSLNYTGPGTHSYTLVVTDLAGLQNTSPPQTVTVS